MGQKIALVLSTGGARGIAHIGVIEELLKQGFEIASVAGCSMGALVGAAYVSGSLEELKRMLCTLKRRDILTLIDPTLSSKGFIKGDKIMQLIETIIPDKRIEDLAIPYLAVATDLQFEQERIIDVGSLLDAIRASIAIPNLFTPYKSQNHDWVDGGLSCPLPLQYVKRTTGDRLVASVAYHLYDLQGNFKELKANRYFFASQPSTVMIQKNIELSLQLYPADLLIKSPTRDYNIFQFYKAKELIEIGRKAAQQALARQ